MGLDVSALRLVERISDEKAEELGDEVIANSYQVWHLHSLAPIGYREAESKEGHWVAKCIEGGRVGSYSRLHTFRKLIYEHITSKTYPKVSCFGENREAEQQYWDHAIQAYGAERRPFFYLFWCSDCEGYFPPELCQRIVREMDEHPELVAKLRETSSHP